MLVDIHGWMAAVLEYLDRVDPDAATTAPER
jgi:erythromycin esterase-like protein